MHVTREPFPGIEPAPTSQRRSRAPVAVTRRDANRLATMNEHPCRASPSATTVRTPCPCGCVNEQRAGIHDQVREALSDTARITRHAMRLLTATIALRPDHCVMRQPADP